MDSFDTKEREDARKKRLTHKIHRLLAHSYMSFFVAFLAGILCNYVYPVRIFEEDLAMPFGLLLLIAASMLILWAQYTSNRLREETPSVAHFCQGPYCFSRTPTHWGLFLLLLGFSAIINSAAAAIFSVGAFLVTKIFFLRKEEEALAEKYGTPYIEYKKKVRL